MENDITQTTYTNTNTEVSDYSVKSKTTDGLASQNDEIYWNNPNWSKWYGYYLQIPELKKAIDTFATWVLGKGYRSPSNRNKAVLEGLTGWGEDSFLSILWNLVVTKKINGDSFAEIIRNDKGTLINLKPLDPSSIRIVVSKSGKIKRYEQTSKVNKDKTTKFEPSQILHLCNDRIADNIHGTSVIESVQWVIDARNEAMADFRRILHRSTIRVLYVKEDDKTRLSQLKTDYAHAINKGEVLILPGSSKDAGFQDLTTPSRTHLDQIQYLENFFYQAVGVPKSILGGTQDTTEAASKVGMVAFDPIYIREITDLQNDLYNQLGVKIEFEGQKSMMDNIQTDETKNTGQLGFQANDVKGGAING